MTDLPEEWRPIKSLPKYEVSSLGRIRRDGRVLVQRTNSHGYLQITPCVSGVVTTKTVHGLIAEAFIGEKPSAAHQVNHKDGNKKSNGRSNLEWVTCSENRRHGLRLGIIQPGIPPILRGIKTRIRNSLQNKSPASGLYTPAVSIPNAS